MQLKILVLSVKLGLKPQDYSMKSKKKDSILEKDDLQTLALQVLQQETVAKK